MEIITNYNICGCDMQINAISILGEDSNDEISKIAFPSYLLPIFHNLHELVLWDYKGVEVIFRCGGGL